MAENREAPGQEMVVVGRILGVWGARGELRVEPLTDVPDRFAPGVRVLVGGVLHTVESARPHKRMLLVKLSGIASREGAGSLREQLLEAPASESPPLPDGSYYHYQVLGLDVVTTTGEPLGRITDILPTGSNDVYVVQSEAGELLVPAIDDVVKEIDVEGNRMVVELLPGMR